MSSVTDDSSIADSVSSIGQEEWEKIAPDDDSDAAEHEDATMRPSAPVDAHRLQETVLVYPTPKEDESPRPVEEIEEEEEEEEEEEDDDTDEPVEIVKPESTAKDDAGNDIESHWHGVEDFQVNFDDRDARSTRSPDAKEAVFPLAKISGATASSYLANTRWQDLDHVAGAVRMKLGADVLRLSRPFKLFYFGDGSVQGALEAKIGSALVASRHDHELAHQRRRYSVLPVSWDKESPQVELMPDSGAALDVETCVAASQTDGSKRGDIEIICQSGQTILSHRDGKVHLSNTTAAYQLPDLAIIHINDNDDARFGATSAHVQRFLRRHLVPTLLVSSGEPWQTSQQGVLVDTQLPHLALQVPGASHHESQVFDRLPIDVDTFLRLNSLQLSRNLANAIHNMDGDEPEADSALDACSKALHGALQSCFNGSKLFVASWILLLVLSISATSLFQSYYGTTRAVDQHRGPLGTMPAKQQATVSKATHTLTLSDFAELTATPSPVAAVTPLPFGKELIAHVSSTERDSSRLEKFEAELYGDSVVIVRPPRWFASLRRAPELTFKVDKDGKSVKHNATHLGEKVYALSLPREHAHGIVDVHIRCAKWPKADQTIQLDLGSAWAKLLDWMKATSELTSGGKNASKSLNTTRVTSLTQLLASAAWTKATGAKHLATSLGGRCQEYRRVWRALVNESGIIETRREMLKSLDAKMKEFRSAMAEAVDTVGREITTWRQSHFREEQKNLLKIWWRLTGKTPAQQETAQRWRPWSRPHDRKKRQTKLGHGAR